MNHRCALPGLMLGAFIFTPALWADHPSVGVGTGTAASINTESARTLPRGQWSLGLRTEYVEFDELSDAELHDLREADEEADLHSVDAVTSTAVSAFYGLTDTLTVGVRVPYIHRNDIREPEHEHGGGDVEVEALGDAQGIGDTTLFAQYRFYESAGRHHLAAIAGLKAPTGKTTERSRDGHRLEAELQPGSGSWDTLAGLAYTHTFAPFTLDASALYTWVTEGDQETDLGDVFSYNLGLAYRLGGAHEHDHTGHRHGSWDLVLELNGEWRDQEDVDGVNTRNSGGTVIYLSPGVRFTAKNNVSLFAAFGVPVEDDLNGDQGEPDYRLIGGLVYGF